MQNAFEYISTLPNISFQPETLSFEIPWIGKSELRNKIISYEHSKDAWKKVQGTPGYDAGAVQKLIDSIDKNINTLKEYDKVPILVQKLYFRKEEILNNTLASIEVIQNQFSKYMEENKERYEIYVENFRTMEDTLRNWQELLDVFASYERECTVCTNERWNLQHWLWIIIEEIMPKEPILLFPRYPDLELDFTDVDLSFNIKYPVIDIKVVPFTVPIVPDPSRENAPAPLAEIPAPPGEDELKFDLKEFKVIDLPDLPYLPNAPTVSKKLDDQIEKLLTLIKKILKSMCNYRHIPL